MNMVTQELPKYVSHKTVWALKIAGIAHKPNPDPSGLSAAASHGAMLLPDDVSYIPIEVDAAYMTKHQPQMGGYYVKYSDGYESFSPAKAFEEGYAPLVETKTYADGTTATGTAPLPDRSPTADEVTEQRLVALGKTAPRLSPADLKANIVDIEIVKQVTKSGQILRWAILTTKSGFAVTGRPSASVSAENDVPDIGEETAIANSTQELWPLMGYELKCRLHEADIAENADILAG